MTLNVETVMAVSILLSVFAGIAALGSSIVLGAGFERLRAGFEIIAKQTSFFSDMLNRLEKKVEVADVKSAQAAESVRKLDLKLDGLTEQTNVFAGSIQQLAEKVGCMDSLPTVEREQEPVNPYANIQRYFESDSRKALIAVSKEQERKRKNALRTKMHAIAQELDGLSPRKEPVNDSARWARLEAPSSLHFH